MLTATVKAGALELLLADNFDEKSRAIALLGEDGGETAEALLSAIVDSRLYYLKKDKRIVVVEKSDSKYRLTDPLSGEDLGLVSKRKVKKISINNRLRREIRSSISRIKLTHEQASVRLTAVETLMGKADEEDLLQLRSELMTADKVTLRINAVIAFSDLGSDDIARQLGAIERLDGSLHPAILIELRKLVDSSPDSQVSKAAASAIRSIETRVSIFGYLETLFFGLSLGSILALAAVGLAITFGVMGVINMAHGELIMIGAYTTYIVQLLMPNNIGASILVAIPAAFAVAALTGVAIERLVIRFLYGRPLETLLATFGISLFLQQAVRSIFSPLNRPVSTPEWMSGSLQVNSLLSASTYSPFA